jgi:hypothetical protein
MKDIGRLAMRVEGDNWVAYYALTNTMDDALFLGKVKIKCVLDQDRKDMFMWLMREAVADIIEETTGERPEWKRPHRAPEHERSGSA